jgi:hypothetical protein
MVVVLAGVVEEAGILGVALLDDVFETLVLETGAFQKIVAVGDIRLMMLVMVELEGLLRHVRLESLVVVGQRWEFESHGKLL